MGMLMLLLAILGPTGEDAVDHDLDLSEMEVSILRTDRGSIPEADRCVRGWVAGLPDLPLVHRHLEIPEGTRAVDLEVLDARWATVPGEVYVPPLSPPTPLRVTPAGPPSPDPRAYSSADFHPSTPARLSGTRRLPHASRAVVVLSPFRWRPSDRTLQRLESLSLRLTVEPAAPAGRGGPADGGMLIVTDASLTGPFEELAARRTVQGIPTEVVTVEEAVGGMPGRDDAEKLRNYVIDYHSEHGIEYLLLGGDTDLVPYRKAYAMTCEANIHPREDSLPSDLYFADLDGDWDANGNGTFGEVEDDVDLYADLHVGRAPVEDLPEAEAFVGKIGAYEDLLEGGHIQRALFLAEILWTDPYTDSSQSKELIDSEHVPDWFFITKLYESLGNENLANTMEALNEGTNMVNHDGHAWYSSIGVGEGYMGPDHFDAIDSDGEYAAFLYSIGCWSAAFDFDAVAEHFVTNPDGCGVAWIGNSSYGWGSPGNPTFGYSDILDQRFFGFLFDHPGATLGELLSMTKETYVPFAQWENVYRWHLYDVNLLGDPSFRPYRQFPPEPSIDCPEMVTANTRSFPVQVSEVETDGLALCVADQGSEYHVLELDASGYAHISFGGPPSPPVTVTVSGPGVRRSSLEVEGAAGPGPAVAEVAIAASGGSGHLAPGEEADLSVVLTNQGTEPLGELELTVDSISGPAQLLAGSSTYPPLAPGDSAAGSEPFCLSVEPAASSGQPVYLLLSAEAPQGSWQLPLSLLVQCPGLYFSTYSVDDGAGGNGNGFPEPGESFLLDISIANLGLQDADSVSLVMEAPPSWMTWVCDSAWVESIGCDSTRTFTVEAQLDPSAPSPTFPWLFFDLLSPSYSTTDTLRLTVGVTGVSNDVESGPAGWTHSGAGDMWHIDDSQSHSPTHSWFCGSDSGYGEDMDCGLQSPELVLAPDAQLSFWGTFDAAIYGTDGLYVLLHRLGVMQTDTLDFIGSGGALGGSAKGQGTGWAQWCYDLDGYEAGEQVRLELRFVSDSDPENGTGFHVDDINVSGAYAGSMGVSMGGAASSPLGNPCPNPSTGAFSVPVLLPASSQWTLGLYDLSGRLVLERGGSGSRSEAVSARESGLAAGVYLVRLQSAGSCWTRRLVLLP